MSTSLLGATDQAKTFRSYVERNVAGSYRRQRNHHPQEATASAFMRFTFVSNRVPVLADIVTDLRGLVVYALEEFAPAAVSNEMRNSVSLSSRRAAS